MNIQQIHLSIRHFFFFRDMNALQVQFELHKFLVMSLCAHPITAIPFWRFTIELVRHTHPKQGRHAQFLIFPFYLLIFSHDDLVRAQRPSGKNVCVLPFICQMCRLNLYRNFRTPNFYSRVQK
jgi:hypothetical protein